MSWANPQGFGGGYVGGCEEKQFEMWGGFRDER